MTRLLCSFFGLAGVVAFVAAAPVPTHLMPKDPPLYHPVQKGTRWVYEGGARSGTFVISAVEKDEKDKKDPTTVITIAQVQADGKESPYQKFAVSRRGILWTDNPSPLDTPVWLLKSPVKVGESWAFRTSGAAVVEGKGTMLVAGVETVEVPAGKFIAVRVVEEFTGIIDGKPADRYRQTFWFAPGVGIVQLDFDGIKSVLKSFTPGKDRD